MVRQLRCWHQALLESLFQKSGKLSAAGCPEVFKVGGNSQPVIDSFKSAQHEGVFSQSSWLAHLRLYGGRPNCRRGARKHAAVRIGIAVEAMRPRLAVHADARLVASGIAEARVERKGTGLGIEVYHQQAVISVLA